MLRSIHVALVAYVAMSAGLVWQFGAYALIGCGAVLFIAAMVVDFEGV